MLKAMRAFKDLPVGTPIKEQMLEILCKQALPSGELSQVLALRSIVREVHLDIKSRAGKATVGDIIGHPRIQAFFENISRTPVWKLLQCPTCERVVERDITSPSPCTCGYNWSSERQRLLEVANSLRPKSVLEHFEDAQKGQT